MRKVFVHFVITLLCAVILPFSVFGQDIREGSNPVFDPSEPRQKDDEFIVKFRSGIPSSTIQNLNAQFGVAIRQFHARGRFHVLGVPPGRSVSALVDFYRQQPIVEYAEPHFTRRILYQPNDQYFYLQWHFHGWPGGVRMQEAWDISPGGDPSVIVAIVDSGITQGSDLASTLFVPGYDFINNDSDPKDDNSHGTHVAGTVAQSTNNGIGVTGIAFNTKLMPVKVCNAAGSCSDAAISDGIHFAVDSGAKVINMSLGGPDPSETMREAVEYAYNNGVTVIAAAGNANQPQALYPAGFKPYAIAIGATDLNGNRTSYSNYGAGLDLMAPGGECDGRDLNKDGYVDGVLQQTFDPLWASLGIYQWAYYFKCGTSMASPHAAAAAALILSVDPSLSPDGVRTILEQSAKPLGQATENCATKDFQYGCGLLDVYAAVQTAETGNPPPPLPPAVSVADATVTEGNSGTVAASFTVSLSAASAQTVSVNYSTQDNTASAGSDYEAASGTISFLPGETVKTVTVNVYGDTVDESNETFFVNLNGPVNATIADGQATGTIMDDDDAPSTASITVVSPNGGETWRVNQKKTIQWTSSAMSGNVNVGLSRDGGLSWTTILANTANDGSQSWKVTGPGTTQARIRVCSAATPSVCDMSNGNFTIK